jgi:1,4-dihydroxy-2-naphthoate octaprenyltransferase
MKYWVAYISLFAVGYVISMMVIYVTLSLFGIKNLYVAFILTLIITVINFVKNTPSNSEPEEDQH